MEKESKIVAILCPNCGKLVNSRAKECIHCGYKNPGRKGLASILLFFSRGNAGFIQIVSLVSIVLYILSIILDPSNILKSTGFLNLLAPSIYVLDKLGMTGSYAMENGRWWTLITAIYLHGSLLHIIFNVLWIRNLGPVVEELYGTPRLILIFTISGILGFIVSNLLRITFTIGASGSIFGLLGALIFYGRSRGGVFGETMFRQLAGWAIMLFVFGFLMPGINNYAHAGGFIGGYLSGWLLGYNENKPELIVHKNLAAATIIISLLSFILVFLKSLH